MQSPTTKVILYVVYAFIVVGLLTAIVTSFHSNKVSAPTQHSGSSQGQPSQSSGSQQAPKAPNQPSQPQPTAAQPTPAATGANGPLNNTGPGDTVGIFVAATAAGAIGYRVVVARKLGADKRL